MEIHGLSPGRRPCVAYHDHSSPADRERLVRAVGEGQSVAYVSEAGTPLLADPGFRLAADVRAAGGAVLAVPGASALLAALSVAGLPTDRFLFCGFLPPAAAARRTALAEVAGVPATLVFYETPRRLDAVLADMALVLGAERPVAVCRELTKRFEEVTTGRLGALELGDMVRKGEIVLVVGRAPAGDGPDDATVDAALRDAMRTMRVKDAATAVAGALGRPRREVYQRALGLAEED
jgi:16S rRNA (cytidine1402-2'-O)-methyltransferase